MNWCISGRIIFIWKVQIRVFFLKIFSKSKVMTFWSFEFLKYFWKIIFLFQITFDRVGKNKKRHGFELLSPRRSFSTTFCEFLTTLTLPTGVRGFFVGDSPLTYTPWGMSWWHKKKNYSKEHQKLYRKHPTCFWLLPKVKTRFSVAGSRKTWITFTTAEIENFFWNLKTSAVPFQHFGKSHEPPPVFYILFFVFTELNTALFCQICHNSYVL